MVAVAKRKTTDELEDDGPFTMTFRCDGDLRLAFIAYLKSQRVAPTKTDVMTVALQDFLRSEGFYPPKRTRD